VIVGLPAEFPPLDTLDLRPHNLPAQATPLLGRERELAAAQELLLRTSVRLVPLTGPAGTGKTRLAVQLGAETIPHFGSGVFFVPLASTREPALVASTVAQTLGLRQFDERSPLESLKEHLRTKPMLLVLDNFEHVLQAAPQVAELLLAAPALKILVTSRAPLRLLGEHEFPVPPLAVPTAEGPLDPAEIQGFPAVDLFVLRAQAVQPDFRLTGANAGSVVDVCRRLDGLPLAIELAATRVKLMSPAAMLPRLERRLEFLRGGRRDMPERHQTLRGAIGWSYDLLRPPDQALFRRLCALSGAFSLELARDLHDAPPRLDLDGVEGIATLVDESLVQRGDAVDEQPRFVVLETIREYGLEQLSRAGEEPPLRAWLARHFVHLAELAAPALTGPDQAAWLDRLEREHANLRSALDWCASPAATADDAATGVRLAGALWRFWMVHGYVNEGREWIERMLACAPHAPPEQRARALLGAGNLASAQGDLERTVDHGQRSLALYAELGDARGRARALNLLGVEAYLRREHARAVAVFEEARDVARDVEDRVLAGMLSNNLGEALRCLGDVERAGALYRQALEISRELGNRAAEAVNLYALGLVSFAENDPTRAGALYRESLAIARQLADRRNIALCLEGLARVHAAGGDPERAVRLFAAEEALQEAVGAPLWPAMHPDHERDVAATRERLGLDAFQSAWSEGRRMTFSEILDYALSEAPTS
ncbi:MAG: tetratricopeptide repeat protein, partial [Gemmatimonadota bacterium]